MMFQVFRSRVLTRPSVLLFGILLQAIVIPPGAVAQTAPPAIPDERPPKSAPFPNWMDSVSFPKDQRTMQGPQEPVDPDPRSPVRAPAGPGEKRRFQFNPPKMPDLSRIRKKAWKSQYQRIGSSSETLQHEQFTSENLEAEHKRQYELGLLFDAFPPGPQRDEIAAMLTQQQGRVAAAEELLRLIQPASDSASVTVDLGTRGLPQTSTSSAPLSSFLDLGTTASSETSILPKEPIGASPTAPAPMSPVAPPQSQSTPASKKPVRDAQTDRRIRELLQILYPASASTVNLTPPPEMPPVHLSVPRDPEAASPAPPPAIPASGSSPQVPTAAPEQKQPERGAASSAAELTAPEPAHIPERFHRPTPTPSLFRESHEDSSDD